MSINPAPKTKRQADQLEEEPQRKRVRLDPGLDTNPRPSPNQKPARRPVPQHASPATERQKIPTASLKEASHQYLKQTVALNRRHDSVRSPLPANLTKAGLGVSSYNPHRQANPAPRPPSRDAERSVVHPGPHKYHDNRSSARKGPAEVSLRGGGSEVGSSRRNNPASPGAARTPARHPSRRLSSASPCQTHLHPHVLDEVRAMDAEKCPGISPEEMDMLRKLYIACQQHPEKFDEYRHEYAVYQQRLKAQKGLFGGEQPVRPQSASPVPEISPRSAFKKPEIHEAQRELGQVQFRPAYSPRCGPSAIFRGDATSPSHTPAAARERPVQSSPNFKNQHALPDTPQTAGNHQRKRSRPIPRIIFKVPKRTQQPNEGIPPVKGGYQGDIMSSPRKDHSSAGGKTLEEPPIDESGLVVIDDLMVFKVPTN